MEKEFRQNIDPNIPWKVNIKGVDHTLIYLDLSENKENTTVKELKLKYQENQEFQLINKCLCIKENSCKMIIL